MTQELTIRNRDDIALAIAEIDTRFAVAARQRELLEKYIKGKLISEVHYYKVNDDPKTKPSLKKEGAELVNMPHNLKPRYEILSGPQAPPPDNSPYQLTLKCGLWNNEKFGGEGIGSASSYQTTKTGAYQPRQKDPGLCYNATIKVAQKSAYIAATLNATAASEFFTQDLEDFQTGVVEDREPNKAEHYCEVHKANFYKKGKMRGYAHPIAGTNPTEWCNEGDVDQGKTKEQLDAESFNNLESAGSKAQGAPPAPTKPTPTPSKVEGQEGADEVLANGLNLTNVKQVLNEAQWLPADMNKWLSMHFKVAVKKDLAEMLGQLTPSQAQEFLKALAERRELK